MRIPQKVMMENWLHHRTKTTRDIRAVVEKKGRSSSVPKQRGNSLPKIDPFDEDVGPWTEPIALGVYCIDFGSGLPLRKDSERDSPLLVSLERGRYVEVTETKVMAGRVRARCIVYPRGSNGITSRTKVGKSQFGWISLVDSAASPVGLGEYVVVSENGCVITEGANLCSKMKYSVACGMCIEVVATRIEDGVVRGLVSSGGYVNLISPGQQADVSIKLCMSG